MILIKTVQIQVRRNSTNVWLSALPDQGSFVCWNTHCIQTDPHNGQCTECSVSTVLYNLLCTIIICISQYTHYIVHCELFTIYWSQSNLYYALSNGHCIMYAAYSLSCIYSHILHMINIDWLTSWCGCQKLRV